MRQVAFQPTAREQADGNIDPLAASQRQARLDRLNRELADELDPQRYAQIHRSVIVNLHRVAQVVRGARRDQQRIDPEQLAGHRRAKRELHRIVRDAITSDDAMELLVTAPSFGLSDALKKADEVLLNAVQGISDLIQYHGYINVDFADVKGQESVKRALTVAAAGASPDALPAACQQLAAC